MSCSAVCSGLILFCWFSSRGLSVHDGGDTERDWFAAERYCRDHDQRLASITELIGLMLRGNLLERKTDYWSSTSIGNYAFGVNMKSHILSFDRHTDTDHFICVQRY